MRIKELGRVIAATALVVLGLRGAQGCGDDTMVAPQDAALDAGPDVMAEASPEAPQPVSDAADDLDFDFLPPTPGPLAYGGGPVMVAPIKVWAIWYGSWEPRTVQLVDDFLTGLGSSSFWGTNLPAWMAVPTPGFDAGHWGVSPVVAFQGNLYDDYSLGTTLVEGDPWNVVQEAVRYSGTPLDYDAVYFVLTSQDVYVSGFCADFCGWHDYVVANPGDAGGFEVKYSFVGDTRRCSSLCSAKDDYDAIDAGSPNGDWGADGLVNIIGHELSEMATDPLLGLGWTDSLGSENADKCAWTFGPLHRTDAGSVANDRVGSREWLLQQIWVGGYGGDAGPEGGACLQGLGR